MAKKQVVILAAGESSRFAPFSENTHKVMFPVCGKPIIGWTLEGLKEAGFERVVVVLSKKDSLAQEYIKSIKGLSINIVLQGKPLGMGDALLSAKKFLDEEFIVGFGHFVDSRVFRYFSDNKVKTPAIFADKTEEPWKYGILETKGDRAVSIIEKPEKGKEPSNIRASGAYLLNRDYIKILEEAPKDHYNFELALDKLMTTSKVQVVMAKEPGLSLKYPWDTFPIRDYLLENLPEKRSETSSIAKTAVLKGKVVIEDGVRIFDHALIEGPAYLGKGAVVGAFSILRDHSTLEEKAEIQRYADCARSIIGVNSHIHSGFVGDSILGQNVRVGAGFITANRRVDRGDVEVTVKGEKTSSTSSYLGALVGNDVKIGINASTMPGVVIGSRSQIGPGTVVMDSIPPDTLIYSDHRNKNVTKKAK